MSRTAIGIDLSFDIGNSAIKVGLFAEDQLAGTFRSSHDLNELSDRLASAIGDRPVRRAGVASVVPAITEAVRAMLESRGLPVQVIRSNTPLPFKLSYTTPETLGSDRLAVAAAAWVLFGRGHDRAVVAIDAGTACTLEAIDREGIYRGGIIAAGPGLIAHALGTKTAQLPEIRLEVPDQTIGRSTTEAIQSGVMHGFIESVRGLLRKTQEALGEPPFVVVTGGWSSLLLDAIEEIDASDPDLVLRGIRTLMQLNGGH